MRSGSDQFCSVAKRRTPAQTSRQTARGATTSHSMAPPHSSRAGGF